MKHLNTINIGLMLLSLGLATVLPFEVFLLSYAVLGPLHYLTEISWLKDRGYFLPHKTDVWFLFVAIIAIVLGAEAIFPYKELAVFQQYYILSIFFAFCIAAVFALQTDWSARLVTLFFCLFASFLLLIPAINYLILIYLPTLIHVYLFTGLFILFGAAKSRSLSGYLSFVVFLICPIICFILPSTWGFPIGQWATDGYSSTFGLLSQFTLENIFGETGNIFTSPLGIALGRFIAFAYTYHYLNWFSKTSVIKWHKVSKGRAITILLLWIGFVGIYMWDYLLGFKLLFALSFLHVVLEFPLNNITVAGLYKFYRK